MIGFKRRRRGGVHATFEANEALLLVNLAGQVVELLRDRNGESISDVDPLAAQLGMDGPLQPPEDPVLQRLLPDAYRDDADDSAEFRRFTERSLTQHKVGNAERVIETLREAGLNELDEDATLEVELDADAVQAWLRALTDVRLSLAVRLGIETDEDATLLAHTRDDQERAMVDIYDWLGYVQESLVTVLP